MTRDRERGSVVLEAAMTLPIVLLFVLGLIDLANWDLQKSQASSGARDGARVAILSVTGADVSGASANTTVHDAIAARLGGQAFTFTVHCMSSTTTTTKTCTSSPTTVDRDRVQVSVSWQRPGLTFVSQMVGASSSVSASSTMTISG
ncbi:MAG: pilus assembly protein [Actinomycetota bacterium]|nr:pilus assembly protein [Actinomycetota bacterium]